MTAIPFGIYDLVEAMDNVESAEAGGDAFPTTRVLTADGVVSLIGALMGNPFINAVYIGHPGWKAIGGRIGYSAATGVMVLVLSWFGILALLMAVIPVVAITPILLYIGMLIGAQAFQETPKSHAPAVVLALVPQVAAWGKLMIDSSLGAAGTNAAAVGLDKLGQVGVIYHAPRGARRRRDPGEPDPRRDRRPGDRSQDGAGRGLRASPVRCSPSSASCTARRSASARRRWWRSATSSSRRLLYALSRSAAKVPAPAMAETGHGTPIGSAPA